MTAVSCEARCALEQSEVDETAAGKYNGTQLIAGNRGGIPRANPSVAPLRSLLQKQSTPVAESRLEGEGARWLPHETYWAGL